MYKKQLLMQDKALKEKWQARFSKVYGDREFKMTTSSGIPVKPFYTASDINDIDTRI